MWIQKVPGGGVGVLTYSSDGRTLYTFDGGRWITAWDPTTRAGERLVQLGDTDLVYASGLDPLSDGRRFLIRTFPVSVWDVTTGEKTTPINDPNLSGHTFILVRRDIALYIHADHRSIAAWNLRTGSPEPLRSGWDLVANLLTFDFSPDDRLAALVDTDGYVTLFDMTAREEVARFEPPFRTNRVFRVRFSPDGRTLLVFVDSGLQIWDVPSRALRVGYAAHGWFRSVFAFNPVLPIFATLRPGLGLTISSLETGEPLRSLDFALGKYVRCLAFAPDGLTCAVGGSDKQFAVFDVDL